MEDQTKECKIPQIGDKFNNNNNMEEYIHDNIVDEVDECPDKLFTSFKYIIKNYLLYGIGSVISVIIYIIVTIIASIINKSQSLTSSAVIFIFANVAISLICAYCITKPYQYYLDKYYDEYQSFKRYKDSINEDVENVLTLLFRCAIGFVALPFLLCCCRCIAFRKGMDFIYVLNMYISNNNNNNYKI